MAYRIRAREGGGWDVVARANSHWVAPERADDRTYRERYWSPTVMIRGGMALVCTCVARPPADAVGADAEPLRAEPNDRAARCTSSTAAGYGKTGAARWLRTNEA
jgi:hypothetical protein